LRPAEAERIARDLYGLAVTISALPGERDCNFRLRTADAPGADAPGAATREFVLKIHDVAVDAESTDCLVSVLDHLAEQDPALPVPRLFPTQQGDAVGRFSSEGVDYSTCLVSFLPGRLLAALRPSTLLLQNLGATLARVDRALQGFFHPSLMRRLAWYVRHLPELAQFSGCIQSPALRAAGEAALVPFFTAGDPDLATAVWGTTAGIPPNSTRARQTGDNIGIQYGLNALLAGAITPEEFVTLNEKIGGFDADWNRRPARTTADLPALDIAYRAGIVSSGKNLGKLPIIDSRGYDEQGIHYIWRSFAERARIDAANDGNHGNQVMWRYGTGLLPGTAAQVAAVTLKSFLTMDTWLSNLNVSAPKETLNSVRTQAEVIQAKPATALPPSR